MSVRQHGAVRPALYAPARNLDAPGRFAFGVSRLDQFKALSTTTWLLLSAATRSGRRLLLALVTQDGDTPANGELFGSNGLSTAYVGFSNRYQVAIWNGTGRQAQVVAKVLGDAVRLEWTLTNTDTVDHTMGLTGDVSRHDFANMDTGAQVLFTFDWSRLSSHQRYIGHLISRESPDSCLGKAIGIEY
ncbi:MAG: hypothetical protein R2688_03675 [Fimbriimonadaceae bacterium]